jgi:hypothetical protein
MNQIINMVMRIIMRRVLSKGVDAGFRKAGQLRNARKAPRRVGLTIMATCVPKPVPRLNKSAHNKKFAPRDVPEGRNAGRHKISLPICFFWSQISRGSLGS